MTKRMLIDANHPEETRVVILDGSKVEEFDFEAASRRPLKGNIYLAKVTRVEPSLQAAFVEYGGNRQGFLAFAEIHPDYYQIPMADRQALLAEQEAEARRRSEDDIESFEITGPKADAAADEEDEEDEDEELDAVEDLRRHKKEEKKAKRIAAKRGEQYVPAVIEDDEDILTQGHKDYVPRSKKRAFSDLVRSSKKQKHEEDPDEEEEKEEEEEEDQDEEGDESSSEEEDDAYAPVDPDTDPKKPIHVDTTSTIASRLKRGDIPRARPTNLVDPNVSDSGSSDSVEGDEEDDEESDTSSDSSSPLE